MADHPNHAVCEPYFVGNSDAGLQNVARIVIERDEFKAALEAECQLEKPDRPYKLYVWKRGGFLVAVHAKTVAQARELALEEWNGDGDESTPVISQSVQDIKEVTPHIFYRENAECVLTDSGALQEMDLYAKTADARAETAEAECVQLRRANEALSTRSAWLDSDAAKQVLRLICLQLSPMAHAFQELGEPIPTKTEDEQAFMLHKMLGYVRDHGDNWKTEFLKEMAVVREQLRLRREAKLAREAAVTQ